MIDYTHRERIELCDDELDDLVKEYFAMTIAKENMPPLDMNWPWYQHMQQIGVLTLVTARYIGDLVGFVTYVTFMHPHHKTVKCAQSDIIAVKLRKRGNGIGANLIAYAEPVLRDQRVQIISHQFRTCYDAVPLFPKLGYKLEEQSYMKVL